MNWSFTTFTYGEREWLGTVEKVVGGYAGQTVVFTNIRLPNDGYFYTPGYDTGEGHLVETNETEDFLTGIIETLKAGGIILELVDIEIKYLLSEQQLKIFLWTAVDKCTTVTFHYGHHEGAKSQNPHLWRNVLTQYNEKIRVESINK